MRKIFIEVKEGRDISVRSEDGKQRISREFEVGAFAGGVNHLEVLWEGEDNPVEISIKATEPPD